MSGTDHPPSMNLRAEINNIITSETNKTIKVLIEHAHDNPLNARRIYNPDIIKSLAASMATQDQLVPALACLHPTLPGHVILIDGQYRKRGLIAAAKKEIEVKLITINNEIDMYRVSYLVNEERQAQSNLDNALAWDQLIKEGRVTGNDEIAEMTGQSPAAITKTMAVLKLPTSAIEKVREHPAKFGVAITYEIHRCSQYLSEDELLALMDRVLSEDLSSRAIEQIRVKLEQGTQRKKKENSRQYTIKANGCTGFIKDWDSGKVALEVTIADPKDREDLVKYLQVKFGLGDTLR